MAAVVFVPLEILEEEAAHELRGHFTLSRHWNGEDFPHMARSLIDALDGKVGIRAGSGDSQVWEVVIDQYPYHLCLSAGGLAHLEARSPGARGPLEALGGKLAKWANTEQDGLRGRMVPKLPDSALGRAPDLPHRRSKKHFLWVRGVLGFGLCAGIPWLIVVQFFGRTLPWPTALLVAFGLFPLIGYLWALWLWKRGRG